MKTASSDLFNLIHSLSSRERAYFKRFAGMHKQSSDSNYLKVFEAIYEQEEFDEKALKEQFKNDKLSRYFPRVKKYLYDKILESMRLFHADDSMSIQLKLQIISARFLYSKQLFKQAMKKAQQIKKEAEEAEYWAEYLAASEIETSIIARMGSNGVEYEQLVELKKGGLSALQKYTEAYEQYYLKRQMTHLLGRNAISDHKEMERIFQSVKSAKNLQGVSGQVMRLNILGLYSEHRLKDYPQATIYYDEVISLMESHPNVLLKSSDLYLFFIGRLLELTIYQFSFDSYQIYLQKIKSTLLDNELLWHRQKKFRFVVEADYYYYSLLCLFELSKHEQTLPLFNEFTDNLQSKLYDIHPAYQLRFPCLSMLIYFFRGEFEEALNQANKALDIPIDFHPMKENVRLWLLFIQWELENYDLLEHQIRNTVRYWKKQDLYNDFKRFLVEKLQKLMKSTCEKAIWSVICEKLESSNDSFPKDMQSRRWYIYSLSKFEGKKLKEVHQRLVTEIQTSQKTASSSKESLHLSL